MAETVIAGVRAQPVTLGGDVSKQHVAAMRQGMQSSGIAPSRGSSITNSDIAAIYNKSLAANPSDPNLIPLKEAYQGKPLTLKNMIGMYKMLTGGDLQKIVGTLVGSAAKGTATAVKATATSTVGDIMRATGPTMEKQTQTAVKGLVGGVIGGTIKTAIDGMPGVVSSSGGPKSRASESSKLLVMAKDVQASDTLALKGLIDKSWGRGASSRGSGLTVKDANMIWSTISHSQAPDKSQLAVIENRLAGNLPVSGSDVKAWVLSVKDANQYGPAVQPRQAALPIQASAKGVLSSSRLDPDVSISDVSTLQNAYNSLISDESKKIIADGKFGTGTITAVASLLKAIAEKKPGYDIDIDKYISELSSVQNRQMKIGKSYLDKIGLIFEKYRNESPKATKPVAATDEQMEKVLDKIRKGAVSDEHIARLKKQYPEYVQQIEDAVDVSTHTPAGQDSPSAPQDMKHIPEQDTSVTTSFDGAPVSQLKGGAILGGRYNGKMSIPDYSKVRHTIDTSEGGIQEKIAKYISMPDETPAQTPSTGREFSKGAPKKIGTPQAI